MELVSKDCELPNPNIRPGSDNISYCLSRRMRFLGIFSTSAMGFVDLKDQKGGKVSGAHPAATFECSNSCIHRKK